MAVLWIGFDEFVVPFEDSSISSQSRFSQLGTDGFRFTDQSAVLFVKVFQIVRSLNQIIKQITHDGRGVLTALRNGYRFSIHQETVLR